MPNVIIKRTLDERIRHMGGDVRCLSQVGRNSAELMGHPEMAEIQIVRMMLTHETEIVEAAQEDPEKGLPINVVMSTSDPNRQGDVIDMTGWDLGPYSRYPIVLLGHSTSDPTQSIIGKNESIDFKKSGKRTLMTGKDILIPDEVGHRIIETARFIGSIGVSVGFNPTQIEPRKSKDGDVIGLIFTKQELVEHSIVTIPNNRASVGKPANTRSEEPIETQGEDAELPLMNLIIEAHSKTTVFLNIMKSREGAHNA